MSDQSPAAEATAGLMQAVMSELATVKEGLRQAEERRQLFERAALGRLEEMRAALEQLKHPDPTVEVSDEDIVDIAEMAAAHDAAAHAAEADEA